MSDIDFNNNCSLLFQSPTSTVWSEKVRYKQGYITPKTVVKIINFLTEPTKGLLQWIENMDCSDVLDILTPIMFDTMSEDARREIFIIKILDKDDIVHCVEENPFVEIAVA